MNNQATPAHWTRPEVSKPLQVRLIKVGEYFEHDGQMYRKTGLSIPDENNRLGRQHFGQPVVPGPAVLFRAQQQVRKVELPG